VRLVIFDLDDTLVDFATTRQTAYREMSLFLDGEGIDSNAFIRACTEVDRPLFLLFEQGHLTRQEYRLRRFSDPFGVIGMEPLEHLVLHLNKLFMDCVNDRPQLFDDARPVLASLRQRGVATAILTNGPADGQRRKLKATGLDQEVDHVAIGEEVGVSKPLALAFHKVIERFSVAAADTLMVGDSAELDYDAARQAGLAALLLDRGSRHLGGSRERIRTLDELLPSLKP